MGGTLLSLGQHQGHPAVVGAVVDVVDWPGWQWVGEVPPLKMGDFIDPGGSLAA
jgi:hypothetical protein